MEEEIRNFLAWLAKAHGVVIDEMFVDEYMDSKE